MVCGVASLEAFKLLNIATPVKLIFVPAIWTVSPLALIAALIPVLATFVSNSSCVSSGAGVQSVALSPYSNFIEFIKNNPFAPKLTRKLAADVDEDFP